VRRRTRSKSPARGQTKSKSPPRSRSKSPSRTPKSKSEKLTGKSEIVKSVETKVHSSRKSETSVTKNATPKKSTQEQEYAKKSTSKKLESESPSRQSSRIAVKLSQLTSTESELTEVMVGSFY